MIRKSLLLFSVNVSGRAFQYVYRVVMSYFLNLREFGVLSASLPYQSFVLLFTSMSVTPTASKFTSQYRLQDEEKVLNVFSLLLLGLVTGGVLYVLTGLLSQFFGADFAESESVLKILSLSLPFAVLLSICTGIFLGYERAKLVAFFLLLYQVLMIFASYGLVQYTGLNGAAEGILVGYVISGIAAFGLVVRYHHSARITVETMVETLKFSLPVLIGVVGLWALLNVDTLILARFVSAEDVGIYGMAFPTARMIFGFSVALSALLVPKVSELKYKGLDTTLSVRSSLEVCTLVTLPMSVVLALFSEEILYVLFGTLEGYRSLAVLSFGMLFYSLFFIGYSALQGLGYPRRSMGIAVVSAGFCIVLCFLLVPQYGLVGAAFATSFSCFLGFIATVFVLKTSFLPRIQYILVMLPLGVFEYTVDVLESRLLTMIVYGGFGLPFIAAYFYLCRKYLHVKE